MRERPMGFANGTVDRGAGDRGAGADRGGPWCRRTVDRARVAVGRGAGGPDRGAGDDWELPGPGLAYPSPAMARVPRNYLVEENSTNHCTWRSHGFSFVLETDDACREFRRLLLKYKEKHGIEINSYCLMGTHPHVVCRSTLGQEAFSSFWQVVNGCFAKWHNRRTKGRGQVVMERLRSPRIQDGDHQLRVMRYGDLNPVRAGLVRSPKEWKWSSFRHFAYGEPDDLITDAPEYLALGRTAVERRREIGRASCRERV